MGQAGHLLGMKAGLGLQGRLNLSLVWSRVLSCFSSP